MKPPSTTFQRTSKALQAYDEDRPRREALWERVQTAMDVGRCVHEEQAAANLVREAFFRDTQHVNSKDRAFLVHPNDPWLRRIVFGRSPDDDDVSPVSRVPWMRRPTPTRTFRGPL